ncbi:hypothetical protein ACFQ6N_08010 [Kitasatospora sp. NPDC056446]|uniref:hypothetical protein n=1 Tax=Kitasatospora sp. NPDC056446 TaxID=3345819 RepID=UPI00369DE72A
MRGAREWTGRLLVAAGAVLCVLGWYGASGERFVEQQIPYLASSSIPGAALIVAGALLVALRPPPPPEDEDLTPQRVERLYELLVEPVAEAGHDPGTGADTGTGADMDGDVDRDGDGDAGTGPAAPHPTARDAEAWLAVPGGTRYHRPDCPLVTGKARAGPVGPDTVRTRRLSPCPLCSPTASATRPGESAPPAD